MPINFFTYNYFVDLTKLIRLHSPTGYLLVFFPSAFGLILAYEEFDNLWFLPIFFIASILIRGAGCIINDLFDQNLDKKVERTKNRPIASGKISNKEAMIFLAILLTICFFILISLTSTSTYIGIASILLITLYPLMKRITYFPQVFLGITFNTGCLIGYAAIKDSISYEAIIMYIACGFWTIGYDTIYAFMDLKDDKIVGIKSTAIFFEYKPFKLIIAFFYTIFLTLFSFATRNSFSIISIVAILIIIVKIMWIIIYLDIHDAKNCMRQFKINNYIGFLLFIVMILEKL